VNDPLAVRYPLESEFPLLYMFLFQNFIVMHSLTGSVVTQTVGYYVDAEGNQIWICPACGKPDDGSPMIGCDECDDWYHWVRKILALSILALGPPALAPCSTSGFEEAFQGGKRHSGREVFKILFFQNLKFLYFCSNPWVIWESIGNFDFKIRP